MDILEANAYANAFTPHPCGTNDCDRSGCGFNPYAAGYHSYYGPGLTVDTSKTFTVTTQFITNDGSTTGSLTRIIRSYIQNGVTVASAQSGGDVITASGCTSGAQFGGLDTMGQALGRGMVLVFSIWNDNGQFMNWLDSGNNGPCSSTEGNPSTILAQHPDTHVVFSNIRWGDIGSTTSSDPGNPASSSTSSRATSSSSSKVTQPSSTVVTSSITKSTTTSSASGATQTHWGQCGGQGWSGPSACAPPYACQTQNQWYAQCL